MDAGKQDHGLATDPRGELAGSARPRRPMEAAASRLMAAAEAPISNSFLVLFRISFGCCLLWQIWWYFSTGLLRTYYIEPSFHFTWYLFDWVRPWPGNGMFIHFFGLLVCAACVILGFYYRWAMAAFFVGYLYVFLIDRCWYLNHYYLIVLLSFLGCWLPAHRRFSLDVWRNPSSASRLAPAWTLWALRAQVGIPYFYGGIAKLNADWLRGEPMRTWLADSTQFPIVGRWFTEEWCVYSFVYAGILIDLLAVPALLWRKTRWLALSVLILFHIANAQLFQIGVFPYMMIALTLIAFVDPRVWDRWVPGAGGSPLEESAWPARWSRVAAVVLLLFFGVQLLVPLRHWLYPGDTAFTREGHHFSWRMKLNIRKLDVNYYTEDPKSGERQPISLIPHVTGVQQRKLLDPDMILQLAHHLADVLGDGDQRPPIFVEATVALNGRPPSPYVNSTVDLSSKARSIGHADWIYTAPSLGDRE